MISKVEKRRRRARRAYWQAKMRKARAKATAPYRSACFLAWRVLSPDVEPNDWRPVRGCTGELHAAQFELWKLLASLMVLADWSIREVYEPGVEAALNATMPLLEPGALRVVTGTPFLPDEEEE